MKSKPTLLMGAVIVFALGALGAASPAFADGAANYNSSLNCYSQTVYSYATSKGKTNHTHHTATGSQLRSYSVSTTTWTQSLADMGYHSVTRVNIYAYTALQSSGRQCDW